MSGTGGQVYCPIVARQHVADSILPVTSRFLSNDVGANLIKLVEDWTVAHRMVFFAHRPFGLAHSPGVLAHRLEGLAHRPTVFTHRACLASDYPMIFLQFILFSLPSTQFCPANTPFRTISRQYLHPFHQ
ncbi:hypothetical protein DFR59_10793 [Falsibacillus pallidus]|uniref:Uncharacterized protein n=1 Tax=Falsibacillus pallidus TaxID=493781 RepID=A0A370GEV4_9BACI|nr:hypothetical protein DFR59_10793 [Falsibacillus pallidus]